MPFSIQFVRGSLAGRRWPLGEEPLLVGRSHVCAVRPKEPDVSGRHLELVEAGGAVAVTVLSAHRTVVAGAPAERGSVVAATPGSVVELGEELAFRVVDDGADAGETSSLPEQETGTLPGATEGLATAATRFAGDDETGTASLTAATRFAGGDEPATGTLTAATRFAGSADAGETSIIGGATPAAGETGESDFGETQVLETQVASREELEQLRGLYRAKERKKTFVRAAVLVAVFAAVLGTTWALTHREPERTFGVGAPWVPRVLYKGSGSASPSGSVSLCYPTNAFRAAVVTPIGDNAVSVETRIGKDSSTELWIRAEWHEIPESATKGREDSMVSFLERDAELSGCMNAMLPLSRDFFGGVQNRIRGYRHAIPCSRREYTRHDVSGTRWGVVSFFRNGTICFVVRREVPEAERGRAKKLLLPTSNFVFADAKGLFAESQWEGAEGAGCDHPKKRLEECTKRLHVETPAEWPVLERYLRDVLVSAEEPNDRKSAIDRLTELRKRKALVWRQQVVHRGTVVNDKAAAARVDRDVRGMFRDPDEEEWSALARSPEWWK